MKKIASFILILLLVLAFLTTTFGKDQTLMIHFADQKEELAYNTDYMMNNGQLFIKAQAITPVLPFVVPGKGISWDHLNKTIIFSYTDQDGYIADRLLIKIGQDYMKDFDEKIKMTSPAILSNGRVFLPLREISEAYGHKVQWNNKNGKGEIYITDDPTNDKSMGKTEGIIDFSLSLVSQSFEEKNILISPLSIVSALGMVANGAKGNTLAEMEQVLNSDIQGLNDYLKAYSENLPSSEKYQVSLANSIWFKDKETLSINEDFLQLNKDYYHADIYKADFDEETKDDINIWVKEKTNGMIESLLDEAPPEDAVMYLINALSFDGEWDRIYDESHIYNDQFTLESGEKQDAAFMNSSESVYLENERVTGFMKPYKDNKYAFVALLPKDNIAMSDVLDSLNGQDLLTLINNKTEEVVRVQIPKFSVTYDSLLNDPLQALGMGDAFSLNKADFTGLAKSTDANIFINRVIHKTKIDVDEKGTKAGAVTGVEMSTTSILEEIKEVTLDRPFFYMIVDTKESLPLFMGSLMSIK